MMRAVLMLAVSMLVGCQMPALVSAVGQNIEREKKIEVLAKYAGLDNKRVAVMVKADMGTLYEHPSAIPNIALNLSQRLHENVPGITVHAADHRLRLPGLFPAAAPLSATAADSCENR